MGFETAVLLIFAVFLLVFGCIRAAKTPRTPVRGYVRCPTCGAKAAVRGSTWECGYCGDSGTVRKK